MRFYLKKEVKQLLNNSDGEIKTASKSSFHLAKGTSDGLYQIKGITSSNEPNIIHISEDINMLNKTTGKIIHQHKNYKLKKSGIKNLLKESPLKLTDKKKIEIKKVKSEIKKVTDKKAKSEIKKVIEKTIEKKVKSIIKDKKKNGKDTEKKVKSVIKKDKKKESKDTEKKSEKKVKNKTEKKDKETIKKGEKKVKSEIKKLKKIVTERK